MHVCSACLVLYARLCRCALRAGSTDPYFELYRYRAYQQSVSQAVWEQMKDKLWQCVYRATHLSSTTAPVWPLLVIRASELCAEEWDRPILIRYHPLFLVLGMSMPCLSCTSLSVLCVL